MARTKNLEKNSKKIVKILTKKILNKRILARLTIGIWKIAIRSRKIIDYNKLVI